MFSKLFRKFYHYALLMRLHRPIGIFLLLWPTLWALWIASHGHPSWQILSVLIAGTIIMRSAGCIINDFADRKLDGHVRRTRLRPLANGQVSIKEALIIFCFLCLIALGLVLLLNRLALYIAFMTLGVVMLYPFTKRFIHLPQLVLGFSFACGILMAFAAQTGTVPAIAWFLFFIDCAWVVVFDTIYAMVDKEDDLRIGIKSTAILFGNWDRAIISLLQILILVAMILLGIMQSLNVWYYLSLAIAGSFFAYQQYLIRNRDPEKCFRAFLNNNWFGFMVFIGLILS